MIAPIKKLPRSLTASLHLAAKENQTSPPADMTIPNGATSDAIDDVIDFSELEAK